jgi:hypothetical protein
MQPRPWQVGADLQTTLSLPGVLLTLDLATHPTDSWAALATVVWSGNQDPDRVMVSVFHPDTHTWGVARQVDLGPAQIGRYSRTVAIGITGDSTIHVVWAMSDPDFRDGDPPAGVWASQSHDYGVQWSVPQRIASDCRRVNDLVANADGQLAVLLTCDAGRQGQPVVVLGNAQGWQPPERLDLPVWLYSEGQLLLYGQGDAATLVGLMLAERQQQSVAYLFRRRLVSGDPWELRARPIILPQQQPTGLRMWYPHGLVFPRPDQPDQVGLIFSWSSADDDIAGIYALTSLDGGRSWGPVEPVVYQGQTRARMLFAPLAYDPRADRLVVIWSCCADTRWQVAPSTHYARWSRPGSGLWWPPDSADSPLVLGARVAAESVTAQAANSQQTWLAWIEQQQQIQVRSVALNQIIPADQYLSPTGLSRRLK